MDHISASSSTSATPRIPSPVAYLARDETADCPRITNLRDGVARAQKATKRAAESPSTLSIPQELWYPRHHDPDAAPLPAPRLSIVTKLLPLAALIFGYTAAVASSRHLDAVASLLLFGAFVWLLWMGYAAARFAYRTMQYRRGEVGP
ncbi:MAG: hypothetical protein DLM61_24900 [Pseudonocardiales bacterium]|nr:MAG: hypothetical protein DLM61_24900 [Pseudonocardiales bacterium]